MQVSAKVRGIRSAFPERAHTNEDLSNWFPEWSVEKIAAKTGIQSRRIAERGECASDLAARAAQRLFEDGICTPDEVEFLLLCTQSPDYFLPTTACLLQERLGLRTTCGATDFNLGCSGFVYGLSLAKGLIETQLTSNVLLITSETYSKFMDPSDKKVRTIFGDGAAATYVVGVQSDVNHLGPFVFGTDGSGARNLIVEHGAMRGMANGQGPVGANGNGKYLHMDGAEIFNFTLRAVPKAFGELLTKARREANEIDCFVFHQANKFMLDALRKKLNIPPDRFCIAMGDFGNTVSASIPMAIEAWMEEGRIMPGQRLMLIGFGVGYSWAGCLVQL